jgi:hypothetical protein
MVTKKEVYEVHNLIDQIGKEKGLDEEGRAFLKHIVRVESGGDIEARPPVRENGKRGSRAYGLFQFTPGTWADLVKKYPGELTMEGLKSPRQQIIGGIYHTRDNGRILSEALGGVKPTREKLCLAHFDGLHGAIKVLKAHPETRIDTLLSKEAFEANGPFIDKDGKKQKGVRLELANGDEVLFKDFTARDHIVWANRKMAQPDGYELMSAEERGRYRKDKGIMDFLPDALGDMQMSSIAMIGLAIIALLGVVFSGSSSGNQSPASTPQKSGGKGRGLFS